MTKCMVCGDEFDPYYKAQRLCQSCLDKFTKRYWDWNEYRKQGHTRRPTCIVCDKPLTCGFSVCPDCRAVWKKIYYEIMRPQILIQAMAKRDRKRMNKARDNAVKTVSENRLQGIDNDITAARKAGMSYGLYIARKKGLVK